MAALATQVLPLLGVTTFLEGLAIAAHGLLRGIGRQSIGGPTTISAYYLVALPTSLALGFGLGWRLHGLLLGLTIGLSVYVLSWQLRGQSTDPKTVYRFLNMDTYTSLIGKGRLPTQQPGMQQVDQENDTASSAYQ